MCLPWCLHPWPWASAEIFLGGQRHHFANSCQVADDAMQSPFTKHFTLSTRVHHKENAPCYNNSHKAYGSLKAIARYITITFTIGYLQIFKAGCFFSEVLSRSLTKPQIMTLFYLGWLISVTLQQALKTSGISSKAINHTFNKILLVFADFLRGTLITYIKLIIHKPEK